jgi:hypothetical protein
MQNISLPRPKTVKVKFVKTDDMWYYHDLPNDWGFRKDGEGKFTSLQIEGVTDAVQALHLVTTYPDNFKLVDDDIEDVRDKADKLAIKEVGQVIPGAPGIMLKMEGTIKTMIAGQKAQEQQITALQKTVDEQAKALLNYDKKIVDPEANKAGGK